MIFKCINPDLMSEKTRGGTKYLLRGLTMSGLNPPKIPSSFYSLYMRLCLLLVLVVLPTVFIMGCLDLMKEATPGELVKTVQVDLNAFGLNVKFLIAYLLKDKLASLNLMFDKFDEYCTAPKERDQIRRIAALGNRIYIVYFFGYMTFIGSFVIDAMVNGRLPFYVYNIFFDWRKSQRNLYIQCVFELFFCSFGILIDQAIDCIPIIYVQILREHIKMLTQRISANSEHDDWSAEQHNRELITCIKLHRDMLHFCNELRPLISLLTFVQFLICGTVLGLTVINLMFFADLSSTIASSIYLFDVLLQSFPLCYLCNSLVDDCRHMSDTIFHSRWHDKNKSYRKSLIYFLQKSQEPMTFSALGIFPINVDTNLVFAKFAFTVYTLAKEAKIDEMFQK